MKNTEIKSYVTILTVLLSLFTIYQFITQQLFYDHLKRDSIETWGKSPLDWLSKILKMNPKL